MLMKIHDDLLSENTSSLVASWHDWALFGFHKTGPNPLSTLRYNVRIGRKTQSIHSLSTRNQVNAVQYVYLLN